MATSIRPASIVRDVAGLMKANRRTTAAFGATQMPTWTYDRFVVAGTPATTYQLTFIPYGINVFARTATGAATSVVFAEGTDYTVDYSTGIVTVSATLTASDVLYVSYVTTDDLTALSGPADTGKFFNVASTSTSTAATIAVFVNSGVKVGDLLVFAAAGYSASAITADPTGWTRVDVARGTGTSIPIDVGVWWKIATSGDPGSTSAAVTFPNSDQHVAAILAYSGCTGVRASAFTSGSAAAGATLSTPTLSATSGDFVISLWAGEADNGTAPTLTIDPADTSRANVAMNFPRLLLGDETAAGGTTTARTAGMSDPGNFVAWVTGQIAIY